MAVAHNLLPRVIQSGLGVLTPTVGVNALETMLNTHHRMPPQLVISPFEWKRLMAGANHVYAVDSLNPL